MADVIKMKTNSIAVLNYLKENNDSNLTSADVAEALDLAKRTVDGIFTSAIQKKGFGYREEAEIELDDGTHKKVKFLHLTPEGLALEPVASDAD